jgi:hypothetical protein
MDEIKYLSERAKIKRTTFLAMRKANASPDVLRMFANQYADALEAWHKAAKPGRKFRRPSFGYLVRAM